MVRWSQARPSRHWKKLMSPQQGLPPVFVVGSGRSGTTWIGGTIAACAGCIPIFEPLQPELAGLSPRWGLNSGFPGPYLRAGEPHEEWRDFFDAILSGKRSNWWTRMDWKRVPDSWTRFYLSKRVGYRLAKTQYQLLRIRSRRCVVKEIRANLMLDWLADYTGGRVVFLVRHPCAAIGSRMRQPAEGWRPDLDEVLCQSPLMSDFLEPLGTIISAARTPLERHATMWCVENFVPLSQARSRNWLICFYEDFVSDPNSTFQRVFDRLHLKPTARTERSKKWVTDPPINDPKEPRSWHAPLSEAEGETVLQICEAFGLRLYGRQCTPLVAPESLASTARAGIDGTNGDAGASIGTSPAREIQESIGFRAP
jgi:hypothetical protein